MNIITETDIDEAAEEAYRRWKLYKYQQKTGKPALVKILNPFE